jgi:tryptophanyl-tRNA synthetase
MIVYLQPIREKISDIQQNENLLKKVAQIGKEKASERANKTLKECREAIGFRSF